MPNLAYLEIKQLAGISKIKGREKTHAVTAFSHKIAREIDPHNGQPSGRKVHSELVIQKEIDERSHWFHKLHDTNVVLPTVVLHLWHMPPSGTEVNYLTIELSGARIVQIEMFQPSTHIQSNSTMKEHEKISFIYDKIRFKENPVPTTGAGPGQPGTADAIHQLGLLSGDDAVFHVDWVEESAKGFALQTVKALQKWITLKLGKTATGAKVEAVISKVGFIKLYEAMYRKTPLPPLPVDPE